MNRWILINAPAGVSLNEKIFEAERYEKLACGPARAYFQRDGRFANDQLFAGDDHGLLIADGVILNLSELKERRHADGLARVIRQLSENPDKPFFSSFMGPFCGAFYDKQAGALTVYTNHSGDAAVFYHCSDQCQIASNDCNLIARLLRGSDLPYTLDETAVLYLMTYGYMIDERTMLSEVKRVLPGKFARLKGGSAEQIVYHRFSFEETPCSFEEAVELVDAGFRKAVRRCFEKDREYQREAHWSDLSGGFDSRMTTWVAKDLGYDPLSCFSYSQSGSDEHRCASRVAEALGVELFHKQLDEASFLYDIDRLVEMNHGLSIWFGITGGEQLLRTVNLSRFGLEHTGQIGDAVIGSIGNNESIQTLQHRMKYSTVLSFELSDEVSSSFSGAEEFAIYIRAFMGALSSHFIRRNYIYAVSPFLDPEFLALCMSLPVEHRLGHKLYWAWLDQKYPLAAKLPSTNLRSRKQRFQASCKKNINRVHRKLATILSQAGMDVSIPAPNGMNPITYWYRTKPEWRSFIEQYYVEGRHLLDPWPEIAKAVDRLYTEGSPRDKLMAMNVVAVAKLYFS